MIEKIKDKEMSIRLLLEELRNTLNAKRQHFNQNPGDWDYILSLSFTENQLNEMLEYLKKQKTGA
jgi:ribosomal protein S15P/S13E